MTDVGKRIIPFVVSFALGLGVGSLLRGVTREVSKAPAQVPSIEISSLLSLPCELTEGDQTELSIVFNPPAYSKTAREKGIRGMVRLYAYTGQGNKLDDVSLDDVRVVRGLSADLNAQAAKAARRIRIRPATFCGRPLVEPVELEYEFPSKGKARLIEL
jgi:hypothetical protein